MLTTLIVCGIAYHTPQVGATPAEPQDGADQAPSCGHPSCLPNPFFPNHCRPPAPQIEPRAGNWKTWALSSGAQFRLKPPPRGHPACCPKPFYPHHCRPPAPQIEPRAGNWKTWALSSGAQFRLKPPPRGLAQEMEIRSLISRARRRDPAALAAISFWDAGPPGYRWNEIAFNEILKNNLNANGPRISRILALLNVAIYDATVAAWDSKYVYHRPRPSE